LNQARYKKAETDLNGAKIKEIKQLLAWRKKSKKKKIARTKMQYYIEL